VKHTFTFSATTGSYLLWNFGSLPGALVASDTFELTGAKKGGTVGINQ
jgi:predicted branched-subunit amino acid permease